MTSKPQKYQYNFYEIERLAESEKRYDVGNHSYEMITRNSKYGDFKPKIKA